MSKVISAEQFSAAVDRSGRTDAEIADLLGKSRSTVHRYKRGGVEPSMEALVLDKMREYLRRDEPKSANGRTPLRDYTNYELLVEIADRLEGRPTGDTVAFGTWPDEDNR